MSSRSRSVSSRSRRASSSFGVERPGVKTSNQFQALAEEDCQELSICQVENLEMRDKSVVCKLVEKGTVSQVVQQQGEWVHLGFGEITDGAAADESCWPRGRGRGGAFEVRSSILLKTSKGQAMQHVGEKDVTFKDKESGEVLGMTFQVTEVRKPLAAV